MRVCEVQGSARSGSSAGYLLHRAAFDRVSTSPVNCDSAYWPAQQGALSEHSSINDVVAALTDPNRMVVVQHAPSVSVSLGEEFGVEPGQDVDGKMVAALRRVGFDRVFDTSFTADLTIMEEASELAARISGGGVLPMFTSCSPGWIKFVEQFYPDLIPNLSSCKSPQQMMGAVIKSYFAEREKIDPARIVSVSIMPCTAKKFECNRPEMAPNHVPDVDYVLTTREAAQLLRMFGVDLLAMTRGGRHPSASARRRARSSALSGSVMEAAVRTAHFLLTGKELDRLDMQPLRGMKGAKEIRAKIGDLEVGAAVVSGLGNARKLLEEIRAGRKDLHFIEFMTCPGGCINGGGQPIGSDPDAARARMQALYRIDQVESLRVSHKNTQVARLYEEYLGKPLGKKSHQLLHTHYNARDIL